MVFVHWLGEGRFQGVFVTDAIGAAKGPEGSLMNEIDGLPRKEDGLVHWANFWSTLRCT